MNRTQVKRKSRAAIWSGIFMMLALVVLVGCEEDDPLENPLDVRANYLGVWQVTENTGVNHPQFYSVNISAGTDDDEIIISGLYNEPNVRLGAIISGANMSIPLQSSEGINFSGNGTANSNYSQIQVTFTADDGSGPDVVEAVMVP